MIGNFYQSRVENFSLDEGTFLYASPEKLMILGIILKMRFLAAGCIAYPLAFGVHPFLDSKPHNTLLLIKKHTEGSRWNYPPHRSPHLLSQTLCVWSMKIRKEHDDTINGSPGLRPKATDPRKFVQYLRSISGIGSWIAKEFRRLRKDFAISKNIDEIFIYFIIKFQATVLKMALKILNNHPTIAISSIKIH